MITLLERTTIEYLGSQQQNLLCSDDFGCCSSFNECSKLGVCINTFDHVVPRCSYRRNLEKGCRYYGSKYQLGISDMGKIKQITKQHGPITFQFTVGKNRDKLYVHLIHMIYNGTAVYLDSVISDNLIKSDRLLKHATRRIKQPNGRDNAAL